MTKLENGDIVLTNEEYSVIINFCKYFSKTQMPEPKTEEKPPETMPHRDAMTVADAMAGWIITNNPKAKFTQDNVVSWAWDIEKMNRIDKISYPDIMAVMVASQKDLFWQSNILSGSKLRKQWNTLSVKFLAKAREFEIKSTEASVYDK